MFTPTFDLANDDDTAVFNAAVDEFFAVTDEAACERDYQMWATCQRNLKRDTSFAAYLEQIAY